MGELGVKPEVEIYDTDHLDVALHLHRKGLLADPLQSSIVLGVRDGAPATPESLISMVRRIPEVRRGRSSGSVARTWP